MLKFRAKLIAEYDAADEIYFYSQLSEPKYIYYLGEPKSYVAWNKVIKKHEKNGVKFYDDDNNDKINFVEKENENSFWNYINYVDSIQDNNIINSKNKVNDDDIEKGFSSENEESINIKIKNIDAKVESLNDLLKDIYKLLNK